VDLGVDHGVSSLALALDAVPRRNTVFGVDLTFSNLGFDLRSHPHYHRIRGDTVTVGRQWDRGCVDLVFIDSLHVEPHVLSELHAWFPHVRTGGTIIVHDTAWPEGSHDLRWHPGADATGVKWPTPDRAVAAFFGLEQQFADAKHHGFHHVDDDIEVAHHPESWGMTVIRRKSSRDLRANVGDWPRVFAQRTQVLCSLMDAARLRWFGIDLGSAAAAS